MDNTHYVSHMLSIITNQTMSDKEKENKKPKIEITSDLKEVRSQINEKIVSKSDPKSKK